MGERKVINKYYPPDFDPTLLPKATKNKNGQYVVRTMANFSMRCKTCGNYIYKGSKFNARHEFVAGESYLGISIRRFYIKCPRCSSEITWKTDPQNSDYTMEEGAIRTTDGLKVGQKMLAAFKAEREAQESGDVMKQLENRTLDNKMEMDILDGLDKIRTLNAKVSKVDPLAVLEQRKQDWEKEDKDAAALIDDYEELAALEELEGNSDKSIKDAVKRLEADHAEDSSGDEDFDPAHPSLFAPFKPKPEEPKRMDSEGFSLPKPIKVKKTSKPGLIGHSPIISIQTGVPGKGGIALKFEPRFRKEAIVHDSNKHMEAKEEKVRINEEKERKEAKQMEVEDEVQVEGGFSLVDY